MEVVLTKVTAPELPLGVHQLCRSLSPEPEGS
jgi:hypothetical protein